MQKRHLLPGSTAPRPAAAGLLAADDAGPAITSDSNALVLVTPFPNSCEANRSVVPRTFGRCNVTGPAVVFTGHCQLKVVWTFC